MFRIEVMTPYKLAGRFGADLMISGIFSAYQVDSESRGVLLG